MRWCETVPDAELALRCEGAEHRLRWRNGQVTMTDHPDRDGEEAMAALGGRAPACLEWLKLWELAIDDGGFLEEWVDEAHLDRARLSWLAMALERLRNEGFHEFLRSLPPARAEPMGRFLSSFPRPWLDRTAAAVAERVVDRSAGDLVCDQARLLLPTAIAQRVRRSVVTSVAATGELSLGAAALIPLTVECAEGPPSIDGSLRTDRRSLSLSVGPSWLYSVWAAGAAIVDGQLVLSVAQLGPAAPIVGHVVRWSDGRPSLAERELIVTDATWRLR